MRVTVRVPAKINIVLSVGPQRPDGFHTLATVYQAVSLYDELTAHDEAPPAGADGDETTADGNDDGELGHGRQRPWAVPLSVTGTHADGVPADASNLAVRAVHALADAAGMHPRASLEIRKRIPVAAGLAGGSADAAGALLACNELWGLGWSVERLSSVAAALGSDVPFALVGGTALGSGRGETLQPVPTGGGLNWVLATVHAGLSTPAVYRRLDELRADGSADAAVPSVEERVLDALRRADVDALGPLLGNDMQDAALDLHPPLAETLRVGLEAGAVGGIVSGSGPTCVFLARDRPHSRELVRVLTASRTCAAAEAVIGPVQPER